MFSKKLMIKLSPKNRKLLNYMEKNYIQIINLKITEFALKMKVSPSFITKSLKKVGYYGWKDWIAFCLKDMVTSKSSSDIEKYIDKTLISSIRMSLKRLDLIKVKHLIEKIKERKTVNFTGWGYSFYIAEDQKRRYNYIGFPSRALNEKDGSINTIEKNSVLFVISISGYTSLTKEQVEYIKKNNVFMVLISGVDQNLSHVEYDLHFSSTVIDNTKIIENRAPRHSRLIIHFILDIIYLRLFNSNPKYEKMLEMLSEH